MQVWCLVAVLQGTPDVGAHVLEKAHHISAAVLGKDSTYNVLSYPPSHGCTGQLLTAWCLEHS